MAQLPIQEINEDGLDPAYVPAGVGGDSFQNMWGDVYLEVINGDASPKTVTVIAQRSTTSKPGFGEVDKPDAVVSVPAGETRKIGTFPKTAYNDSAGDVQVSYSDVTGVTVGAFRAERAR